MKTVTSCECMKVGKERRARRGDGDGQGRSEGQVGVKAREGATNKEGATGGGRFEGREHLQC